MLQCGGHIEPLLKGAKMRLGRVAVLTHMHRSSANKETRMKEQFGPTEPSCIGKREGCTVKELWDLAGGCSEWRVRA